MNIFNMINKKILLIGSRALLFHKPDFKLKENADYDFISDYSSDELKVILNLNKVETTSYSFLNNYEFINYISENNFIVINGIKVYPVSLKGLAIMYKFKNIKLHVVNYKTYTSDLTLLNFLKDSSFGRGTRYIIFEFFKKECSSFQLFNSRRAV